MAALYPEHSNDIGDWCPWSGEPRRDERCPAGCRASAAEDDEEDPEDGPPLGEPDYEDIWAFPDK